MINVGIVGIGFMGWIHFLAYERARGIRVGAVCSGSPRKRSGDWRGVRGNFGPEGGIVDLSGVSSYGRLEEMLNDPGLDLIDICLPPCLHARAAAQAFEAGKHVFCEKPLALNPGECRRMVGAAEKAGKQLLVGHVLPFFPEYAHARSMVAGGKYGRLLGGRFHRIISSPPWLGDYFDPAKVGGPMIDLHVHDAHFIRMLFGMPEAVSSSGRMRGKVVEYCSSLFHFADPSLVVAATCGTIPQQGRSFTHGFELQLEKATVRFESAVVGGEPETTAPLTVFAGGKRFFRPRMGEADPIAGFVGEIGEVVRALHRGRPSQILGGELARDAIILCRKQTESVEKGRRIRIG
ncbi:Gfo/Idh/MocA family protein [Verrucomicrobiota bacterium]